MAYEDLIRHFREKRVTYGFDDLKTEDKLRQKLLNQFENERGDNWSQGRIENVNNLIEQVVVPEDDKEVEKTNQRYISDTIKTIRATNSTRDFPKIDNEFKEETINEIKTIEEERAEEIQEEVITKDLFEAKTEEEVDEQLNRLSGKYRTRGAVRLAELRIKSIREGRG